MIHVRSHLFPTKHSLFQLKMLNYVQYRLLSTECYLKVFVKGTERGNEGRWNLSSGCVTAQNQLADFIIPKMSLKMCRLCVCLGTCIVSPGAITFRSFCNAVFRFSSMMSANKIKEKVLMYDPISGISGL